MINRRAVLILAAGLMAAGCATPTIAPAGVPAVTPRLETDHFVAADGAMLPVRSWLPDRQPVRAVILALHGFNDYGNFFAAAGAALAAEGIASYAYDQRGFGAAPNRGLWAGAAALTSDLRDAARLLRRQYAGRPLYLLGESMGGAVILVAMGGTAPPDADGVILAAPAVWGRASMPWYQSVALWMAAHSIPDQRVTGRGLGIRASDNTEMLIALGQDPLVIKQTRIDTVFGLVNLMDMAMAAAPTVRAPVLLLYGENDQLIPGGAIGELLERLPAATPAASRRFALYADGWHMLLRDTQAAVVWADIAAWIARPQAALPSGADRRGADACPNGQVCAINRLLRTRSSAG